MSEMSRQEAIKTIQEFYYPILSRFWLDEKKDVLADALEMAIEALKERPHGYWRNIEDTYCVCSNCNWKNEHWQTRWMACPNCDAKMDGKEGEKK